MDCSTPGLPVHHQLPETAQTHVHWVGDVIQPSHPLSAPSSIFPSIRVFSNESALRIRWPKYWSFSFSISASNEHPGLISFRMDWLDLLAVQGTLKSLLQHHSSKASILRLSAFFIVHLSHPYMTAGETIALTRRTFVGIFLYIYHRVGNYWATKRTHIYVENHEFTPTLNTVEFISNLPSILFFFFFCHTVCGISVSQAETELGPWQWKPGILTAKPQGNSQSIHLCNTPLWWRETWFPLSWMYFFTYFISPTICIANLIFPSPTLILCRFTGNWAPPHCPRQAGGPSCCPSYLTWALTPHTTHLSTRTVSSPRLDSTL